jgi:hypothetical protein
MTMALTRLIDSGEVVADGDAISLPPQTGDEGEAVPTIFECEECGHATRITNLVPRSALDCAIEERDELQALFDAVARERWSFHRGTLRERLEWCKAQHAYAAEYPLPPLPPERKADFDRACVQWYGEMLDQLAQLERERDAAIERAETAEAKAERERKRGNSLALKVAKAQERVEAAEAHNARLIDQARTLQERVREVRDYCRANAIKWDWEDVADRLTQALEEEG